jgi:hypothetical protein
VALSKAVHGTLQPVFRTEWQPIGKLGPIIPEWRSLAERALEPNAFYEPGFALAAAPVFGRNVYAGLVWSSDIPQKLVGLFPARVERRRYGMKLPVLVGWTHPYGPLGTPLVDRDMGEAVLGAWLDRLAADPSLPSRLLIPYLPEEGPVARALSSALARRNGRNADFARHRRALLAPSADRAAYLDSALSSKKRKELRRQRRRLAENRDLAVQIASEPVAVTSALRDFLTLEAAGWKGRAGTAASHDPEVHTFLETAVVQLAREGKAQVARLLLDRRAVAAIIVLRSGDAAWCWKIAYDESIAQASPGVQLLLDVTEALLADATLARADSCATPDHPMIDHIWRERLAVADRLICVTPGGSARFTLACALEATRRSALGAAKALRDRLRPAAAP